MMPRILFIVLLAGPVSVAGQDRPPPPLFTDMIELGVESVRLGDAGWGDLNGDGRFDLVLTGAVGTEGGPVTRFYFHREDRDVEVPDPEGGPDPVAAYESEFDLVSVVTRALWHSSVTLFDFDGDSDLDVAVTGMDAFGETMLSIYENLGAVPWFRPLDRLAGIRDGDMTATDVDGDGDSDLVLVGADADGRGAMIVVENRVNEGAGFREAMHRTDGLADGSVAAADFDLDGRDDLLVTGRNISPTARPGPFRTVLYRNVQGAMVDSGIELPGLVFPFADWGDFDADGDPDVVLIGARMGPRMLQGQVLIYENTGSGFTEQTRMLNFLDQAEPVHGRFNGSGGFADFNGDGLADVFLTGAVLRGQLAIGQFFLTGHGGPGWESLDRDAIDAGVGGRTYVGDYDGDGDLDVLSVGESSRSGPVFDLLRNSAPRGNLSVFGYPGVWRNTRPLPPDELQAQVEGRHVTLAWQPGSDSETPASGLMYEVRVGRAPGDGSIVAALSAGDGKRLTAARGNAGARLFLSVSGLDPGTYWWTVQSVDAAFAGSEFAPERSFTIR